MANTVIGFFKHESDAQKAVQRLQELGISRDRLDISRGTGSLQSTGTESDMESRRDDRDNDNAITRFFKNLFGDDDDDADRYATIGKKGYSIVTVHATTASDAERAADVLDDCGAADVDETYAQYNNDRANTGNSRETDRRIDIPKVQEELRVGKRNVDRGGVRVRSRIIEKPVEESIRLREEHVRVDRQPVNRPVSDADNTAFQDQDIELTERTEIPVVNKEARVVEEIRLSKDVTERNETVRDTVRNTEVDIDENNRRDINREQMNREDINRNTFSTGKKSDDDTTLHVRDSDDDSDFDTGDRTRRDINSNTLKRGTMSDDNDKVSLSRDNDQVNLKGDDDKVNLR
jgi:stress response protein YsnF